MGAGQSWKRRTLGSTGCLPGTGVKGFTLSQFVVGAGEHRQRVEKARLASFGVRVLRILQPTPHVEPRPGTSGLPSNSHATWTPHGPSSRVSPSGGGSGRASHGGHVDSPDRAAQGAGPMAPVGGREAVRVRLWARGGSDVRRKASGGRQLARFTLACFATVSGIIRVSEPAGGRPDPRGRGRSADPGPGARDGRPGR